MNKKIEARDKKLVKACFNELGYDDISLNEGYFSGIIDGKKEYYFLAKDREGILVIATVLDADVVIRYSKVEEGYYERVKYTFVDGVLTNREEYVSYNDDFGKKM